MKLTDTPAFINFPGENGEVRYGEGLFVGYRYYDAKNIPTQFPFGYGLSYTSFDFKNAKVSAATFKDVDGLTVSVDVTNTGEVTGKEVVQVYVHDQKSGLVRPPKELKAFAKVELEPGETKTVNLELDFRSFAFYHPIHEQWITEDGEFDILIGASSDDIRCVQSVTLQSSLVLSSILNRESTLRDWTEDPRGEQIFAQLFKQITAQMQAIFSGDEKETIGMDPMGFLMDMSLMDLLYFQGMAEQKSPEDMVDELLSKVYETD